MKNYLIYLYMVDLFLYYLYCWKITRDFLFLQYFQSFFSFFPYVSFIILCSFSLAELTKAKRYYRIRQRSIKDDIPSAYEKCESTTKRQNTINFNYIYFSSFISVTGVFRQFPHFPSKLRAF